MDDEGIVALLWQRQESGLAELKMKYDRLCRQTAHNILAAPDDVSECINDAYFQLWQLIPPQRPRRLAAFLLKVVRNLALKKYAYNNAQKRRADFVLSLDELAEIAPGGLTPESELDRERLPVAISSFLHRQSRLNRQLFLRRYWYFDSVAEIAAQSALSQGAVNVRLCRLRSDLKAYLQKEGFDV